MPKYELAVVPITSIDLGDRRREDYGDLEMFARTMDLSDGMMHPLFVKRHPENPKRYVVIGGGRRYMAAVLRKEAEVPIRIASNEIDDGTFRLLELLENTQRKDFEWKEQVLLEAEVHDLHMAKESDWNQEKTADLLGKKSSAVSESLQMARYIRSGNAEEMFLSAVNMNEARTVFGKIKKDLQRAALTKAVLAKNSVAQANGVSAAGTSQPSLHLMENYVVGDVLEKLPALREPVFDLIEIDPPYGIDYHKKSSDTTYTEVSDDDYEEFISAVCSEAYRLAKPNSFCILWMPVQRYVQNLNALSRAGWKPCQYPLVWVKPGSAMLNAISLQLARSYEVALYAHKGTPKLSVYGHPDTFAYPTVPPIRRVHSTERPLNLMKDIFTTFCDPGAMILSPFLGSGVSIVAADKCNMNCIGFDLSPQHKDNFIAKLSQGWESYKNNQLEELSEEHMQ